MNNNDWNLVINEVGMDNPVANNMDCMPVEFLNIIAHYGVIEEMFYSNMDFLPQLVLTKLVNEDQFGQVVTLRRFDKFALIEGIPYHNRLSFNINLSIQQRDSAIKSLYSNKFLDRQDLVRMFKLSYSRICEILAS